MDLLKPVHRVLRVRSTPRKDCSTLFIPFKYIEIYL